MHTWRCLFCAVRLGFARTPRATLKVRAPIPSSARSTNGTSIRPMNSTKCSCVNASSFASRPYLRSRSRVTMPVPRRQLRKVLLPQLKDLVPSFLTSLHVCSIYPAGNPLPFQKRFWADRLRSRLRIIDKGRARVLGLVGDILSFDVRNRVRWSLCRVSLLVFVGPLVACCRFFRANVQNIPVRGGWEVRGFSCNRRLRFATWPFAYRRHLKRF